MINLHQFNNQLNEAVKNQISQNWENYKQKFPNVKDWFFVSDYCFDKNKHNNCITFAIFPNIDLNYLFSKIDESVPVDIKNTKKINQKTIDFFNADFFFSVSFLVEGQKNLFYDNEKCKIDVIRECFQNIELFVNNNLPESLSEIKKANQVLKSNNIKCNIIERMMLTAFLAGWVGSFIVDKDTDGVLWFPDRDDIESYLDKIIYLMYRINLVCLTLSNKQHTLKKTGHATQNPDEKGLWFDSLIKIPDYICGTLVSWNNHKKTVDKEKHLKMLEKVFCGNSNINIIKLKINRTQMSEVSSFIVNFDLK